MSRAPLLATGHAFRAEYALNLTPPVDSPRSSPSVRLAETSWQIKLPATGVARSTSGAMLTQQYFSESLPGSRADEPLAPINPSRLLFEPGTARLVLDAYPSEEASAFDMSFVPRTNRNPMPSSVYFGQRQGLRTTHSGGAPAVGGSPTISFTEPTDVGTPSHAYTGPTGTFAMYDMGVRFDATDLGPVDIDFIGGIQAVHATVRASNGAQGGPSDADGFVAIPVFGTRVSWTVNPWFEISGQATTHALNVGPSITGLTAQARFILSEQIDLETGYHDVSGSFSVRGVNATLDETGVFARISIHF